MAINVNTDINYDDKRFQDVKAEEKTALDESNALYDKMATDSDAYYQAQINASKEWADKQTQLQNEKTDFAINEINQQKDQAKSDYTKEQSGAYVDWQKQSNAYGTNAEQRAEMGMGGTGYSESAQVSMYNTYQNRVATARESYNRAVLNYDNAIAEARLQNNSLLAEIAYNALQKQLELSLAGFQYKNTLITEKANQAREIKKTYHQYWQDVLDQINAEIDRDVDIAYKNENIRLSEAQLAEDKRQFDILHPQGIYTVEKGDKVTTEEKVTKQAENDAWGVISNRDWNKQDKEETTSEPTVDMQSVLDLGYGPISAKRLDELIRDGKVIEYVENGKLKYKKAVPNDILKKLGLG